MLFAIHGTNWIVHFGAVQKCLQAMGGRAICNMETGALEIRARGRKVGLFPQFGLFKYGGGIGYTQTLLDTAEFFVGWRPYVGRTFPFAFDKRAFKAFCRGNGVAVPRQWVLPQEVETDVLIKRGVSSFSEGIMGPFTPAAVQRLGRTLADGEFLEEFIAGDIIKVWYWNATPVCMDVLPMPSVTGDGRRTLRQLINRIKFPHIQGDWSAWQAIAEYQGMTLDHIVTQGQRVLAEFRYQCILHQVATEFPNTNVLANYAGTPLMQQLRRSGEVFWRGIPENVRSNILFTVDGILDRAGKAHFVEINSNPTVHPDAYAPMLEGLIADGASGHATRSPPIRLHRASGMTPAR
jgi:hypothetical protein